MSASLMGLHDASANQYRRRNRRFRGSILGVADQADNRLSFVAPLLEMILGDFCVNPDFILPTSPLGLIQTLSYSNSGAKLKSVTFSSGSSPKCSTPIWHATNPLGCNGMLDRSKQRND
jgi:hypothetical protein